VHAARRAAWGDATGSDPTAAGPALLKILDTENPPLRVFFGAFPLHIIPQVYAERLKTWEEWADLATDAEGSPV
jgi:hypothetical protein